MMDISVEELLEQEERKAEEKKRAAAKSVESRQFENNDDFISLGEESRDPRMRGRDPRNKHYDRYSIEREENDERRSRRSRDLADDDDGAKEGSDKGSANGSVRSRQRSRSPRARSPRGRDSHRDRGDYYYGGGRPTSSRDDDRYRPGRGDEYRSRPYDRRDNRNRSPRGGDRDRYFSGRRRSSDAHKKKSPEPTTDEKDKRTVFVQQLATRLRTKDLKAFFTNAGEVVDAQIVKDRVSGRSKGVGYVEFKDEESVAKAIALTGQKLLGIPIIAQLSESEKNRQARNTEGVATHSNGVPFHRLYVGNIHFSVTEEDLKTVFEPFGELEFTQLQKEEQGRSKGYGFVQFIDPAQAKEALEKMNGFELAGRPIRVGLGNDRFTPESTQNLLQRFGSQAHQQGSSFSGMGGRGAHAGGTANFDRASGKDAEKVGGASALDDADVTGVNFSNYSRSRLMDQLSRKEEPQKTSTPTPQPKKAPIEQPNPTRCVCLKHMFDQEKEAAANPKGWQKELEADVKGECEDKYGVVVHIGVALNTDDGEIYVKFDRVQGGENAYRGLNGRFFAGNRITASYVVDQVYNAMFPAAANR